MSLSKLSVSILALAGSALAADLPQVTIKGSKFFYENGTQFFLQGIAYQQEVGSSGTDLTTNKTFVDPLANEANCKRDIPLLQELNTNVIRTYAIDPDADHSACMKLLNDAGIYLVSDLSEPSTSINRDKPAWDTTLFARYKAVVDELSKYSNVIGFFSGNEVSNSKNNTAASAYVKAAARDIKAYIKQTQKRPLAVGYAANDDSDIRDSISHYFNCGDPDESLDFWGLNIYSWCAESSMSKSGYDKQVEFFSDYSIPIFFAESGCNLPNGAASRIFQETAALYSDAMTSVVSGGIVYMFAEEENDYGLVEIDDNGKATKMKDFDALKNQMAKIDPKRVNRDSYTPTAKPAACPTVDASWQANSVLPPTPDTSLCSCMQASRSCVRAKGLDTKSYGDIFDFICGGDPTLCAGINGDATQGVYGAYSMCDAGAKLDFALDAYYAAHGRSSGACDFDSQAQVVSAKSQPSCSKALASASAVNKAVAVATAPVGGGGSTAGASHAKSTGPANFGAPGASISRVFTAGDAAIGVYMLVAALVGASMVAL